MAIASSLLQAIEKCPQGCSPGILMGFSQGSPPESLVDEKLKLAKLFNITPITLLSVPVV